MISAAQIHKKLYEFGSDKKNDMLSININLSGFEFATFTETPLFITKIGEVTFKEPVKDYHELSNYLTQFAAEYDLHKAKYEKIIINWLNPAFTLIPKSFFSIEESTKLLEFNLGDQNNSGVFSNEAINDIKLIYSLNHDLKNCIDKLFPHHKLRHFGYNSINLFFTHFQLKNNDVFLNIHNRLIEILIKKDKQLLLYNVFNAYADEDILYYLLFSLEQYNLNPLTLKLAVAANREVNDGLFKAVKKYIKQVDFVVNDKIIERKGDMVKIPHHFYFSLLNSILCE